MSGWYFSGGSLVISGNGGAANGGYSVYAATNVTQGWSNWSLAQTGLFDGGGSFIFTNSLSPAQPQKYFRMVAP